MGLATQLPHCTILGGSRFITWPLSSRPQPMEPIPREGNREGRGDAEEECGGDGEEVVKLPSVAERISQMETQQHKDKLPGSSATAMSVCNNQ